jgi:hypothetical protein
MSMRGAWLSLVLVLAAYSLAAQSAPSLSPDNVANSLQSRFERLTDYDCLLKTETHAGSKIEAMTFHLWYRRPGLLRLRVLQGRHKGSELVLGPDGTLRGRRGGLLKPFTRRLSRNDPSLRSLRGQPAWELDFGSFLRAMRERMALPGSTAVVHVPTATESHLLLEVRYPPEGSDRFLRDLWAVDEGEWLLASGDVFDGETRVDHVEFSQIRVDQGTPESWFHF